MKKIKKWFFSGHDLRRGKAGTAMSRGALVAAVVFVGAVMFSACSTTTDAEPQTQVDEPSQIDTEKQQRDRPSSRIESCGSEYEHPFPRNNWSCSKENAHRVGQWLEGFATLSHNIGFPPGHPEVEGPQLDKRPHVVIHLHPGSIDVNGHPIGTLDQLVEAPEQLREELEFQIAPLESATEYADEDAIGDGLTLGVVVDPEVPAVLVGSLLEIVDEQVDYKQPPLGLFVGPRNPDIEPVPSELNALLEEYGASMDPAGVQRQISQKIADQVDECEPLVDHFTDIAQTAPENRQQMFVETFPSAWYECDCVVDVELMLSTEATTEFGAHSVVYAPMEQKSEGDWHLVDGDRSIELDELTWKKVIPERFRPVPERNE